MKRIILHWTAGTYFPNSTDLSHYHYVIDKNGKVYNGKYKPEDNENCNDGKYAAHTGGGNTGSIGISVCGMAGFNSRNNPGRYLIAQKQMEAAFKLCAELCKRYSIPITNQTVLTHYEFGLANPRTTSAGKIDISYIPYCPEIPARSVGDYIRNKVKWYCSKL